MKMLVIALTVGFTIAFTQVAFAASKSVTVNVSVIIAPMFELSVSGPKNGNIEFGVVHKDSEAMYAQSSEVVLTAKTNLGEPYAITQSLQNPLSNQSGDLIAKGDLTVNAKSQIGGSQTVSGLPVSTLPQNIYTSNTSGNSDIIKANYNLNVRPTQAAGHYSSRLIYTISTL